MFAADMTGANRLKLGCLHFSRLGNSRNRGKAGMSTAATKTEYIPEDLLTMPDGDRYELVHGKLVERKHEHVVQLHCRCN